MGSGECDDHDRDAEWIKYSRLAAMCIETNEVTSLSNQPEGSKYSNEKAERLADIVETLLERCTYV